MAKLDLLIKKVNDYLIDFDVNEVIYVEEVQAYLKSISANEVLVTQVKELLKIRGFTKISAKRPQQVQKTKKIQEEIDDELDFFALLEDNKEDLDLVESLQSSYAKNNFLINQFQLHDDEEALLELIELNRGLIGKEVRKWSNYVSHKLDEDDLIQEGILGLIKGVQRFNSEMGFKMSTYVSHYIKSYIVRAIFNTGHTVRLPVHLFEALIKMQKVEKEALILNKGEEYIIQKMEIKKEKYLSLKKFESTYMKMSSLNTIVSDNGNSTELFELLDPAKSEIVGGMSSELIQSPLDECIEKEEQVFIKKTIDTLTEREADIIRYRLGFYDNRLYTLEEIGRIYGVTRERIRQIESKAMVKLSRKIKRSKFFMVE